MVYVPDLGDDVLARWAALHRQHARLRIVSRAENRADNAGMQQQQRR
jgi:hypothetical protein